MILCPACSAALYRTGGATWWCSRCTRQWEPAELAAAGVEARCGVCWVPLPADLSPENTRPLRCPAHADIVAPDQKSE